MFKKIKFIIMMFFLTILLFNFYYSEILTFTNILYKYTNIILTSNLFINPTQFILLTIDSKLIKFTNLFNKNFCTHLLNEISVFNINSMCTTSLLESIQQIEISWWLNSLIIIGIILLIINSTLYMKLGTDGIFFVTLIYLILSLLTTIILSYISFYIKLKFEYTAILFDIFNLPNSGNNSATTYYDFISINFIILILSIGTCVFLYSYSYFKKNSKLIVLLNLLLSFILGMIILVSAGDLITLLFGWEAIGISSFLLINFWNARSYTLKSAFKAVTFNKLSDVFLILAIISYYYMFNTFNIISSKITIDFLSSKQINLIGFINVPMHSFISTFFMLCSFIKSAQIFFHIWLPDSMEAPAPASSLIHSATLVSAGIYIVLRFAHIIELSPIITNIIILMGSITAFYGALVAGYQTDVKKILAYSTISHCGFMMVSAVLKHVTLTLYYLFVHGCFKAAAFMCVGNIIHACNNVQDTRKMGNMYKRLPFEFYCLLICLLTLSGYPLTYGYYTKHYVITILSSTNYYIELIAQFFLVLGTLVSFFYFFNFFYYTFFTYKRGKKNSYNPNFNTFKSYYYHSIKINENNSMKTLKVKWPYLNVKVKLTNSTTNGEMLAISTLIILGYIYAVYFFNQIDTYNFNNLNMPFLYDIEVNKLNINEKILNFAEAHKNNKFLYNNMLIIIIFCNIFVTHYKRTYSANDNFIKISLYLIINLIVILTLILLKNFLLI